MVAYRLGDTHIAIHCTVIVYSSNSGWHFIFVFTIRRMGEPTEGFSIAPAEADMRGK